MSQYPVDLKARVLEAATPQSAPTRRAVTIRSLIVTLIAWLIAIATFEAFGGVRMTGRPLPLVFGTVVGTAAIAVAAASLAFSRGGSTLGRTPQVLVPVALATPPLILAWKLFWSGQFAGGLDAWLGRPGFKCLGLTLAIAACPLAAFLICRRFSDPRHPLLTGTVGGLAIGSLSNVLTDLWCPVAHLPHLLLGHLLPIAILGAFGALLGRHLIAVKSE